MSSYGIHFFPTKSQVNSAPKSDFLALYLVHVYFIALFFVSSFFMASIKKIYGIWFFNYVLRGFV